jgi:hypothetical protein
MSATLVIIDSLTSMLQRRNDGRLTVLRDGTAIPVRVQMCFPWSEPRRFLSLRDDDDVEILLVEDPATLDPGSRAAIEGALAEAGFVFHVTRVVSIEEEVEIRQWSVETVHGVRSFQTHLDDWPRLLPSGDLLIRDVAGDLYLLVAPAQMDRRSRELLWAFVD